MALSNWLTRDEWNACYFAGMGEILDGKEAEGLGDQLRLGIGVLHRAGYKFRGIDSTPEGDYTKVTQCCEGNESVLAEMMGGYGGFNKFERAKETLEFAKKALPNVDFTWLEEVVKEVEEDERKNS